MGKLALISPKDERVSALDNLAKSCQLANLPDNPFENAIVVANAMVEIRQSLTPELMAPIMALQNTKIGFKCDKNYDAETVKNALIEATLRGVRPVGNEFNIIAGQCYITKEGFGRLLREIPGLKFSITPDVPKMKSEREAEATVTIEWRYNGESEKRQMTFAIRVNSGMGADAIIGKATRKARAWLYNYLTDMELGDGDADDAERKPIIINPGKFDAPNAAEPEPVQEAEVVADDGTAELDAVLNGSGLTTDDVRQMCEERRWPFDAEKLARHIRKNPDFLNSVSDWKAQKQG